MIRDWRAKFIHSQAAAPVDLRSLAGVYCESWPGKDSHRASHVIPCMTADEVLSAIIRCACSAGCWSARGRISELVTCNRSQVTQVTDSLVCARACRGVAQQKGQHRVLARTGQ